MKMKYFCDMSVWIEFAAALIVDVLDFPAHIYFDYSFKQALNFQTSFKLDIRNDTSHYKSLFMFSGINYPLATCCFLCPLPEPSKPFCILRTCTHNFTLDCDKGNPAKGKEHMARAWLIRSKRASFGRVATDQVKNIPDAVFPFGWSEIIVCR